MSLSHLENRSAEVTDLFLDITMTSDLSTSMAMTSDLFTDVAMTSESC